MMLKKTITYDDLDGNQITEDFYFNLTKAEIAEMELSQDGGLSEHLQKIVETADGGEIIRTFKQIVLSAYGQRSEDGKRFIKSPELSQEFAQTEAYSELFMELVTNADASSAFIRGIVPSSLSEKIEEAVTLPGKLIEDSAAQLPKDPKEMSKEELIAALQSKDA